MQTFNEYLKESVASDKYEKNVADHINGLKNMSADRPKVSSAYSDVRISRLGNQTWLEVKMNHTDNLSNPRIFFDGRKWDTTYTTPAAKFAVEHMNKSQQARDFIQAIEKFSGIKGAKIPTTKSGLKDPKAIPLDVMKEYFAQPGIDRYIMTLDKVSKSHFNHENIQVFTKPYVIDTLKIRIVDMIHINIHYIGFGKEIRS